METVLVNCDIKIYYISVLNGSGIRNSMAYHLIYWRAAATRETVVVKGRRVAILRYNELVDYSINFLSGDSYCYSSVTKIKSIPGNLTSYSYLIDLWWCKYGNNLFSNVLFLDTWLSTTCIVWPLNMRRNISSSSKSIWMRSHWARIFKAIIFYFVFLFMK